MSKQNIEESVESRVCFEELEDWVREKIQGWVQGHCHVNRVGPQRPALDSLSGDRTGTFPYIECVFSKSFECESIA